MKLGDKPANTLIPQDFYEQNAHHCDLAYGK